MKRSARAPKACRTVCACASASMPASPSPKTTTCSAPLSSRRRASPRSPRRRDPGRERFRELVAARASLQRPRRATPPRPRRPGSHLAASLVDARRSTCLDGPSGRTKRDGLPELCQNCRDQVIVCVHCGHYFEPSAAEVVEGRAGRGLRPRPQDAATGRVTSNEARPRVRTTRPNTTRGRLPLAMQLRGDRGPDLVPRSPHLLRTRGSGVSIAAIVTGRLRISRGN